MKIIVAQKQTQKSLKKSMLLTAVIGFLGTASAFSLSLESLLPEAQLRQLMQSGVIDREHFDETRFAMVPRFSALEQLLETNRRSIDPNITVESLRLYRKRASQGDWNSQERTALYNGIVAVSTLKGLEYFSKTRGAMRVLYETSTVIDEPVAKNPKPDPVFAVPPSQLSLYARQKDLTFGDNVYQYSYYAGESSMIVVQENLTDMNYGMIKVIGKNKLRTFVAVFDCGPYLLVYAAGMARASMLPGMKQRAGESIFNRANALLGWFNRKADSAFGN